MNSERPQRDGFQVNEKNFENAEQRNFDRASCQWKLLPIFAISHASLLLTGHGLFATFGVKRN
jgi:hypothetical protein